MHIEVEQKFPLDDVAAVEKRLREIGAQEAGRVEQVDWYFNHPALDFGQTDEALRLRSEGEKNFITYKGPKLDAATKTRRELELPLPMGTNVPEKFAELLTALGFRPVARVGKTRRMFHVGWEGRTVEVVIDEVSQLGNFLELELMADEHQAQAAISSIASLACALGLVGSERRSYLELLLAKRGAAIASASGRPE